MHLTEHTDRIRNRIVLLEEVLNMSSGKYSLYIHWLFLFDRASLV